MVTVEQKFRVHGPLYFGVVTSRWGWGAWSLVSFETCLQLNLYFGFRYLGGGKDGAK